MANRRGNRVGQSRGYHGPVPPTLGYLPANGKHPPAMIAAFGFCDEPEPGMIIPPAIVTGIHLTRLTPGGEKPGMTTTIQSKSCSAPAWASPLSWRRQTISWRSTLTRESKPGSASWRGVGAGVWVAGSAGRMPALAEALSSYVECVHIFAERDGGFRFAQEAARIAKERGIEIHLRAFGERA